MAVKEFPNWLTIYDEQSVETMPWYSPFLDKDLESALKELRIYSGHFLDLGTGPGTQAIELAAKGLQVTASDVSLTAIKNATEKARKKSLKVKFKQDDILHTKLKGSFDYIFDRGCFHIFEEEKRKDYIASVHKILGYGGILFLKCFSSQEPREEGPYRFSEEDIRKAFAPFFELQSAKETVYQGTRNPLPKALFCVLKKK